MRSWKPISLLRFYDWKVMGGGPRAISRRKTSIEMTITPSFSMVKKSFCTEKRPLSYGEVWAVCMGVALIVDFTIFRIHHFHDDALDKSLHMM